MHAHIERGVKRATKNILATFLRTSKEFRISAVLATQHATLVHKYSKNGIHRGHSGEFPGCSPAHRFRWNVPFQEKKKTCPLETIFPHQEGHLGHTRSASLGPDFGQRIWKPPREMQRTKSAWVSSRRMHRSRWEIDGAVFPMFFAGFSQRMEISSARVEGSGLIEGKIEFSNCSGTFPRKNKLDDSSSVLHSRAMGMTKRMRGCFDVCFKGKTNWKCTKKNTLKKIKII